MLFIKCFIDVKCVGRGRVLWSFLLAVLLGGASEASTLDYKEVIDGASRHSHELRMATEDIGIKQAAADESRYLLYPELSLRLNSEHVNDLTDGNASVTAVGDVVFSDETKYQNSISLDLTYNILDCGVRRTQVAISDMDVESARINYSRLNQDVEIALLELYVRVLTLRMEIDKRKKTLSIYSVLIDLEERTSSAGVTGKVEIMDRRIMLADSEGAILSLEFNLGEALEEISFYTGVTYEASDLEVSPLSVEEELPMLNVKEHPGYRYLQISSRKKRAEIRMVKKSFWPQVNFYMRYNHYGSDLGNLCDSYEDIRQRSFSVGLNTVIPLFENLKRNSTLKRVTMEASRIDVEKERVRAKLELTYGKLDKEFSFYREDLIQKKKLLLLLKEKLEMVDRLEAARVIGTKETMEEKLKLILRELELETNIIARVAAMKEIQIMTRRES